MTLTPTAPAFGALMISPDRVNQLAKFGITEPTPIQAQAIPIALEGRDLVGIAQTGTGKTLAFGLPMIERLMPGQVGLVLAPTRELAEQIAETYRKLNVRTALVVGGAPMFRQVKELRESPTVIVATPGRLVDHLDRGSVRLGKVSIAVLDEADRMLDMGFAPSIRKILDRVPAKRQVMLFSATMPREIEDLSKAYLTNPAKVEIEAAGTTPDLVDQELIYVKFEEKTELLSMLLDHHLGSILVFSRTRHGARKLAATIRKMGHTAGEIHADRTLAQRREALREFKNGDIRVLVATDIAARGIDVKDIAVVINFDLPDAPDDYVHRIGRTGRAGAAGKAISIALPDQRRDVIAIEKILGKQIPISRHSTSAPAPRPAHPHSSQPKSKRGSKNHYSHYQAGRPRPQGRPAAQPARSR